MKNIKINKYKFSVPHSWKELSLKQYVDFNNTEWDDSIISNIELISLITKTDYEYAASMQPEEFEYLNDHIEEFLNSFDERSVKVIPEIEINDIKYFIDLDLYNWLTKFYIELDTFMKKNYINNLGIIIALLYKPKDEEHNFENITKRANLFLNEMTAGTGIAALHWFATERLNLIKRYHYLFGYEDKPTDDDEETEKSQIDQFSERWGWETSLYSICGSDLNLKNQWVNTKITHFLNHLTFLKEKAKLEDDIRKQQSKHK